LVWDGLLSQSGAEDYAELETFLCKTGNDKTANSHGNVRCWCCGWAGIEDGEKVLGRCEEKRYWDIMRFILKRRNSAGA